jgi:glycine cleavage system H protein
MLEQFPEELQYSETHCWVRVKENDDVAIIGINAFANSKIGQLMFVELPEVGAKVDAHEEVGMLETDQADHEIYSPVSGEIIAVNEDLEEAPGLISSDPYGDGWIYKIRLSDPTEIDDLLSSMDYQDLITNADEE